MAKKSNILSAATILYAAFIFYLSSLSNPPSPISYGLARQLYDFLRNMGLEFVAYPFYLYILFPDKFLHFFLYLGFGVILNLAVRSYGEGKTNSAFASIALGGVYAASDEIHQMFVPYRSATISDFLVDLLAIITAQITVVAFSKMIKLIKAKL